MHIRSGYPAILTDEPRNGNAHSHISKEACNVLVTSVLYPHSAVCICIFLKKLLVELIYNVDLIITLQYKVPAHLGAPKNWYSHSNW